MQGGPVRPLLRPTLTASTAQVVSRLTRFRSAAEEAGSGVESTAAFALDRRFDEERHLFGVKWSEDGWVPDVPGRIFSRHTRYPEVSA